MSLPKGMKWREITCYSFETFRYDVRFHYFRGKMGNQYRLTVSMPHEEPLWPPGNKRRTIIGTFDVSTKDDAEMLVRWFVAPETLEVKDA